MDSCSSETTTMMKMTYGDDECVSVTPRTREYSNTLQALVDSHKRVKMDQEKLAEFKRQHTHALDNLKKTKEAVIDYLSRTNNDTIMYQNYLMKLSKRKKSVKPDPKTIKRDIAVLLEDFLAEDNKRAPQDVADIIWNLTVPKRVKVDEPPSMHLTVTEVKSR